MPTQSSTYRYPGVKPFETSEKDLFFGRGRDIEDLFDLIRLEKLIVLFAKSGYGKSSLLNAGIIPRLARASEQSDVEYIPVLVRFGSYSEAEGAGLRDSQQGKKDPLTGTLLRRLNQEVPLDAGMDKQADFLYEMIGRKSLWYEFKRRQNPEKPGCFVLIFDQFEEFFSYPAADQQVFKDELAELLYEDMPKMVRAAAGSLSREARLFLAEPLDVKVLFSIRSDRMSLLDGLKEPFPAILYKRYQLKGLNLAQAREAIEEPARIAGERFRTAPFLYSAAAVDTIIAELNTNSGYHPAQEDQSDYFGVEAFQLQIICEHIESDIRNGKIAEKNDKGRLLILPHHLPGMENLYESYYRRKLSELKPTVQHAAQMVLEEGLLAEDPASGEGRRMSVDSRALIVQFGDIGLDEKLLKALSDTFLIRPEVNSVGGVSYELSHDTLIAPVLKAKTARKIEEEKQNALKKQEEAEARAAQEKAKRLEAEQQRRRARTLATLAIVGLIISSVSTFWAVRAQRQAQKALESLQMEIRKRNELETANRLNELAKDCQAAKGQLSGGNSCISDELLKRIGQTLNDMNDPRAREAVENLNQYISRNNPDCPIIKLPK